MTQNERETTKVVELLSVDCVMILVQLLATVIGLEQLEASSSDDAVVRAEVTVNELEQAEEFSNDDHVENDVD